MNTIIRYYDVGGHVVEIRVPLDDTWGGPIIPDGAVEITREAYEAVGKKARAEGAKRAASFGEANVAAQVDGVAEALGLNQGQAKKLLEALRPGKPATKSDRISKTTKTRSK